MRTGFSIGVCGTPSSGSAPVFNPANLFSDGKAGFWAGGVIPSGGHLFQDAVGAVPLTLPGQTVGKIARRAGTVDALQSVAGSRPPLGLWPVTGRRNRLIQTENFENAAWWKAKDGNGVAPVVTMGAAVAPDGTLTAARAVLALPEDATSSDTSELRQYVPYGADDPTIFSVWLKSLTGESQTVALVNRNSETSVTVGAEWSRFTSYKTSPAAAQSLVALRARGSATKTLDLLIWHPQLEGGTTATAYQKVTTAWDVAEAGVGRRYFMAKTGAEALAVIMPEGAYTVARLSFAGEVTFSDETAEEDGPVNILTAGNLRDVIVREGELTSAEKAKITQFWGG